MTASEGTDALAAIEAALEAHAAGRWVLLDPTDIVVPDDTAGVYRIDVLSSRLRHPKVDRLDLIISNHFPWVAPRVRAEQAIGAPRWPHVEDNGLLCLSKTPLAMPAGDRAMRALHDALEVLNAPAEERRSEFVREFAAYWDRSTTRGSEVVSIVDLGGPSRRIAWYRKHGAAVTYLGEDAGTLHRWLTRSSVDHERGHIKHGSYVRLVRAPQPDAYPATGAQVRNLVRSPKSTLPDLTVGRQVPVLLGVPTPTGLVPAVVVVDNTGRDSVRSGFRDLRARGVNRMLWHAAGNRKVQRKSVRRADGAWIHGRDRNENYPTLEASAVTLVGCGSLGSMIARALQQAGVGRFEFVDGDHLGYENLSRHVLGPESVGHNKALAMADGFLRSFPHATGARGAAKRWESLSELDLGRVADTDLLITAGLPVESEALVGKWRRLTPSGPAQVSAWVEEFALVGHAVALVGTDVLLDQLDPDTGSPIRITSWPEDVETTFAEAGCGNVFQPHGAAQLQYTASLTAELALDMLLGRENKSCVRTWRDEDGVIDAHGGSASKTVPVRRGSFEIRWSSPRLGP